VKPEDTRDPRTLKVAWLWLGLLGTAALIALGLFGLFVGMGR
jgi:hypothetical protein